MLEPDIVVQGKCRTVRHLREGGMGSVYAWDAASGRALGRLEGHVGLLGVGTLHADHRLAFAYASSGAVGFPEVG